MNRNLQSFGGDWTGEKLERVRKYLGAYATIMHKQKFHFAYIDAFAGTGYRTLGHSSRQPELLVPELADEESKRFLDGSARIALRVTPHFDRYIFIERDAERFSELHKLKAEFPAVANDIVLVNAEANAYLQDLCLKTWKSHRAVLFLDPFGMQVVWETIAAIAGTEAIDLWILFPVGVAVNRLLTRDGRIKSGWRRRLDTMFGEKDWYDAFYKTRKEIDLFGEQHTTTEKLATYELIGEYFVNRLQTCFAGVAQNPLPMFNSRNVPLYLLCFASGNPRGAKTAIKIAQDILRR